MNNNEFSLLYENELFYNEFKEEFNRIDDQTLEILNTKIRRFINTKEKKYSLYDFAIFLFNIVYSDWSGFLNPELIYLTTKVLVLAGLQKKAEKISEGFDFHPGCCSWRLGSFYRNKKADPKELSVLLHQIEVFLNKPEILENDLLRNDLLAWFLAFKPVNQCFIFYQENQLKFTKVFPHIMLIERLILNSELNKIGTIVTGLDRITVVTSYEKILLDNKKAVWYQLKGDQKNSLEWFDKAESLAIKIGDYYSASKIYFNQGSSYFLIDEYELSLHSYQKAEAIYKNLNDEIGVGKCYNGLSTVYNAIGDYSIAEKYIELASEIFELSNQKAMLAGISYKHGLILYLKGEYEKSLQIIDKFDLKEKSILNFEFRLLKIACKFELFREIDFKEIENLLQIAEVLGYALGKANIFIETSKMLILRGNLKKAEKMLNDSYKVFHDLNNHRGVVRALTLNSLIELLNNNLMEAERFCNLSIEQAKNSNFYLEEKEASIILANIFYLKNQKSKAMNLMDTILYSFESKKIKNNYLLQALSNKCQFRLDDSNSILKTEIVEFIRLAKNSGSFYWIHLSQLQEAEDLLMKNNFSNARVIAKTVIEMTKNYDLTFLAEKIVLGSSISLLKSRILNKEKKMVISGIKLNIEENLERLRKELVRKDLTLYLIELSIIKLYYYKAINSSAELKTNLERIKLLINKNDLKIYLNELNAFEAKNEEIKELNAPNIHIMSLVI